MNQSRNKINTIIDGKLYQRGQILSWKRLDKYNLIKELNVGIVVNFWPKLDPDMSDMPCWYWYLPCSSERMLDNKVFRMAHTLSNLLMKNDFSALILCEAGATRSVFFTALVLHYMDNDLFVLRHIETILPKHKMKSYMVDYLRQLK